MGLFARLFGPNALIYIGIAVVVLMYMPHEWSTMLLKGAAVAVAGLAVIAQLPTSWWMPDDKATAEYLGDAELRKLDGSNEMIKESKELSSVKAELTARGINLYAIVLESFGHKEFQKYFDGTIYLDKKRQFYGPTERCMVFMGLLRISSWTTAYHYKDKVEGNLLGEGRYLGGVFVIGPGDQGIVHEERNMDWGATINASAVLKAAKLVNPPLDIAKL